jgi:hypothetical protein
MPTLTVSNRVAPLFARAEVLGKARVNSGIVPVGGTPLLDHPLEADEAEGARSVVHHGR